MPKFICFSNYIEPAVVHVKYFCTDPLDQRHFWLDV